MARDDESESRVTQIAVTPGQIKMLGATPAASAGSRVPAGGELRAARDAHAARVPFARYRLRCLDGVRTVRRLRPFLRRRESVAPAPTGFIRAPQPFLMARRPICG